MRPSNCWPSLACFERRNQTTSIGAPKSSTLSPARIAHIRVAPVGADDEIGPDLERPVRRLGLKAEHTAILHEEVGDARAHLEVKARIAARLLGEEIEKVPLRHQSDEAAMRRQMREIGEGHALVADLTRERAHLLMRALEEIVENAELVHDLQRRGMDGVAAEIAQEVGVLLQHHDIDAGAGQQKAQHHAGRAATGDGALGGDGFGCHA